MNHVVFRAIFAILLAGLLGQGTLAYAFPSAPYFPLNSGNSWTYRVNGGASANETWTVDAFTTQVNGVTTRGITFAPYGDREFYSNDAGIRVHQIFTPPSFIDGCSQTLGNLSETDILSTPFVYAPADIPSFPTTVPNQTGSVSITFSNPLCQVVGSITYSGTSTVHGIEAVTVPAGTFQALRITASLTLFVDGTPVPDSGRVQTVWAASGIGVVKEVRQNGLDPQETLELLSTNVPIRPVRYDFDGNRRSDVLWRHADGSTLVWQMNGTSIAGTGFPATVPAGWTVEGIGDFDGDGKSDILWRNTASGTMLVWLMNGTTVASTGSPATVGDASAGWVVQGIGDFDGDGKADVLWQNTASGAVYVWKMNGAAIANAASPATVPAGWTVEGVGDFDGDGKSDILWRNTSTGTMLVWLMNGMAIGSTGSPATVGDSSAGWAVRGVGDFDGDGKSDILWQNTVSGTVFVWTMNGATIGGTGSPATVPAGWSVQGVGDYDGNGSADILWRNATGGTLLVWLMNGMVIGSTGSPATVSDPGWQVQNPK